MRTTAPEFHTCLPAIPVQVERLIALGVHDLAGMSAPTMRGLATGVRDCGLFVLPSRTIPASALAPLVRVDGRRAFIVADLVDVDDFEPVMDLPDASAHVVDGPDRGDAMRNWSPDEALPAIDAAGRTPLTVTEGLYWLLQQPAALQRKHCFMTIGSRKRQPNGALDTRTPALWISNGTGRDGPEHRNAPKVGWCWAGNRHTWLGMASAAGRRPVDAAR